MNTTAPLELDLLVIDIDPPKTYNPEMTIPANFHYLTVLLFSGATECVECEFAARNVTHCTCVAGTRHITQTTCEPCPEQYFSHKDDMDHCVKCRGGEVVEGKECSCEEGLILEGNTCVSKPCKPGNSLVSRTNLGYVWL